VFCGPTADDNAAGNIVEQPEIFDCCYASSVPGIRNCLSIPYQMP